MRWLHNPQLFDALAGFVTLGKTNIPELGMQSTTQPLAFGATHNPWDPARSTSGS
jgi:amidase